MSEPESQQQQGRQGEQEEEHKLNLTIKQWLYLIIIHGIGAGVLDGGINTGIAYAMYSGETDIQVWPTPNTLAGDAAVTVFVQVTLTYIIDGFLTWSDVRRRTIQPLPSWCMKSLMRNRFTGFFAKNSLDFLKGARHESGDAKRRFRFVRLLKNVLRGLIYSALVFPLFWGVAVGILSGIYGSDIIDDHPGPQIFKGVFGFVLGVLTTPPVTLLAMAQGGAGKPVQEKKDQATTVEGVPLEANTLGRVAPETNSIEIGTVPPAENHTIDIDRALPRETNTIDTGIVPPKENHAIDIERAPPLEANTSNIGIVPPPENHSIDIDRAPPLENNSIDNGIVPPENDAIDIGRVPPIETHASKLLQV